MKGHWVKCIFNEENVHAKEFMVNRYLTKELCLYLVKRMHMPRSYGQANKPSLRYLFHNRL